MFEQWLHPTPSPRKTGRSGGGVGVVINNQINVKSLMICVKSKNGLKQGTFCNEFNDYLEKLSCMNGHIVIVGDFNIDWLNTDGSERKQFCNIVETFGFVQNICTETHRSHHLLDYIIIKKGL